MLQFVNMGERLVGHEEVRPSWRTILVRELRELSLAPARLAEAVHDEEWGIPGRVWAGVYFAVPVVAGVVSALTQPIDPWILVAPAGEVIELIGARVVTSGQFSQAS